MISLVIEDIARMPKKEADMKRVAEKFPVEPQIPARILPQTEAIDLTRAFLTGRFQSRHIYEALYLVISAVVACEWAMRSLRKRMVA